MLDKIPTLSYKKVASIPWEDDGQKFDSQICALGGNLEIFKTINPYSENHDLIPHIKSIPKTIKCVIWSHKGEWVVKLFRKGWKPIFGYMVIEIETFPDRLDVIFISYDEPNAETNWLRVLEKAPHAKRVQGVAGILNAHKAAAEISETDMFYVVDGDAYLTDNWTFDFQPSIFDRDCAYVWSSKNPVNDLVYQNGGVKLFPKETLLKAKKWNTLDMFSGILPKSKSEDTVSCIGTFNVDPFITWRSAFRECVKLYTINQMTRLNEWTASDTTKPFGEYAVLGAQDGFKFAEDNKNNYEELKKINDYKWLNECFQKLAK
jgi:hypothetical protein